MALNDAKRRELKRKQLLHTRKQLESAREKGFGVNFTSYMSVEEYEPQLIEEELQQACVELNVLNNMIEYGETNATLQEQIRIIHSLVRPKAYLETLMRHHNVNSLNELTGLID